MMLQALTLNNFYSSIHTHTLKNIHKDSMKFLKETHPRLSRIYMNCFNMCVFFEQNKYHKNVVPLHGISFQAITYVFLHFSLVFFIFHHHHCIRFLFCSHVIFHLSVPSTTFMFIA